MTRIPISSLAVAAVLLARPAAAEVPAETPARATSSDPSNGTAPDSAESPSTRPPAPATQTAAEIESRLDMDALKKPPPSAFDRQQAEHARAAGTGEENPPPETDSSGGDLAKDLIQMVIALAIVVGLMYLLFRVGLAKLIGVAAFKGAKTMKVVERVQLDARHALLIVELDGERRLLLGTGEQGIQLLARLDRDGEAVPTPPAQSFEEAMAKTASVANDERSEGANA